MLLLLQQQRRSSNANTAKIIEFVGITVLLAGVAGAQQAKP